MRQLFFVDRSIVLFVYGLTFFVMGVAVFMHSRRHSRLRLARDLYWLAAFGILHGIYEWGDIFIPIQAEKLSTQYVQILYTLHVILLAFSFMCLLMFGIVTLETRLPPARVAGLLLVIVWSVGFILILYTVSPLRTSLGYSKTLARYLLCLPGSLLAAYGLRYQAKTHITPLNIPYIQQTLRIAGMALIAYGIFAGIMVYPADFFPANLINRALLEDTFGLPIEVWRSLAGLVLAVAIIRTLEVFEIEIDQIIEKMEVEQIQATERSRIGQEIHDGAIQGVYSASLILESIAPLIPTDSEVARRLQQASNVLNAVNTDLRSYMISLRAESKPDPLIPSLQRIAADPRYHGLLDIRLDYDTEPNLKPMQITHLLAIIQESLANTLRHARAHRVYIRVKRSADLLQVQIADDGRGFVPQTSVVGYGLRFMRDRARLLGGDLVVDSAPGRGTNIILTLREEKSS
ncbi:MAG: hypothetical protein HND46_23800 [Chloroflexi bacterium]|nr:hypothetical protein [Chloroflexota bacterium]NOG66446.1 hypothetical protein [Chloroflexota bacterium]